jgi:hypothetical protein
MSRPRTLQPDKSAIPRTSALPEKGQRLGFATLNRAGRQLVFFSLCGWPGRHTLTLGWNRGGALGTSEMNWRSSVSRNSNCLISHRNAYQVK